MATMDQPRSQYVQTQPQGQSSSTTNNGPYSPSRPRGSRSFSLKSDKSSGDKDKAGTALAAAEKARRDSFLRGESKANPNAAMLEAQPQVLNLLEQTTLQSLREVQVKDTAGKLITEPDVSNPTRYRWERPLDTIRSFEEDIDRSYRGTLQQRRTSTFDANNEYATRRSIVFPDSGPSPTRYSTYGRRESYNSYNAGYGGSPYSSGQSPRQRYPSRSQSDYQWNGPGRSSYYGGGNHQQQQPYQQGGQDSSGTHMTDGSDSTGPWASSTAPSSQNSSSEGINSMAKPVQSPEGFNNYTYDGYAGDTIAEENGDADSYGMPRGGNRMGPQVPLHSSSSPRRVIPLSSGGNGISPSSDSAAWQNQGAALPSMARPKQDDRRKSWFKRRFSKNE